jgi:hypothetical protein
MDLKTDIKQLTVERWMRLTGAALLAEYLLTSVHHVDEGLGFAFGFFRLNSLLAPLTFAIPLLITLGLLYLFQKTRQRFVLLVFSITAILWWGVGIGLQDGFYNHTLSVLLFLAHVPPQIMSKIYPTFVSPPHAGSPTIPCDGVQFRFCTVTPNMLLYQGTGILSFVVACFLALAVYRLIRAQWGNQQPAEQRLPRAVVVGVCLGLVASFATLPLLGSFMSTGRLSFLIAALPVLGVSVLAVVVAMAWLKRKSTHQLQPPIADTAGRTASGEASEISAP